MGIEGTYSVKRFNEFTVTIKSLILKNKSVFLVFLLVFMGYLINLPIDYNKSIKTKTFRRLLTSYDVTSATFLPYEILTNNTLYFSQDTVEGMKRVEDSSIHSVMISKNKYFSSYPILSGIMAVPIYAIPVLLNKIPELHYVEDLLKILVLGRITASFYTAISVSIFYLILLEIDKLKKFKTSNWIYFFTFFYAFGTNVYSIASRSLWQHTSSLIFVSIIIYLILKSLNNDKYIKWLGFFAGLLYLARPLNIIFIITLSIYVYFKYKRHFITYLLYALPFVILLMLYNTYALENPFTTEYIVKGDAKFSTPLLEGVVGNLFSPARSFLFISPPLVASFYGMYLSLVKKNKNSADIILFVLSITYIFIFLIYSKWWCWYGADRFGYGFFTEWLPITGMFTYLVIKPKQKVLNILFIMLVTWSVLMQFNAVWYRKSRCSGTSHNWSFYCLTPHFFSKQNY